MQSDQLTQKPEQKSPDNAQNTSDKAEISEDVENILSDPDLSIEEKIEALADLPEFTELSFEEKVNMLASLLEEMPEVKDSFSAFLIDEEAPLEDVSLDKETTLDDTDLIKDLVTQTDLETNENALQALEEEATTQEVVAVIQHIFKADKEAPQLNSEAGATIAESKLQNTENDLENIITNIDKTLKSAPKNDNIITTDAAILENSDETIIEEMIEDAALQEATIQKDQTNVQTAVKEAITPILDATNSKSESLSPNSINFNNTQSQQQITQSQSSAQRTSAEFKIATIPLKDNISLVITKAPEAPNKIGINLEPAGMGEAELVIETKDNAVTAVIRSEKADVLDMIRKETASLERHLRDAGIDLAGGSLQFEQQSSNDNQNDNAEKTTISAAFDDQNNITQNNASASQSAYQTLSSLDLSKGVDVRL